MKKCARIILENYSYKNFKNYIRILNVSKFYFFIIFLPG